jgi:hypothetical protein
MRMRQYVYFALFSERMAAAEMTARLLLEPDTISVRASRRAQPPRPVSHAWKIECRARGLGVDEQIGRVLDRLEPGMDRVVALAGELAAHEPETGGARLSVVRYFNDEDGEGELVDSPVPGLTKLPGQHQLLGWNLDRRVLEFLLAVGADLDIDEYG